MKLAKASQAEIDALMRWLQDREGKEDGPPPFMRVVFGYETLVNNCCDPALDYLEFKPETLAAKKDQERIDWLGDATAEIDRIDRVETYWFEGVDLRDAIDSAMTEKL